MYIEHLLLSYIITQRDPEIVKKRKKYWIQSKENVYWAWPRNQTTCIMVLQWACVVCLFMECIQWRCNHFHTYFSHFLSNRNYHAYVYTKSKSYEMCAIHLFPDSSPEPKVVLRVSISLLTIYTSTWCV